MAWAGIPRLAVLGADPRASRSPPAVEAQPARTTTATTAAVSLHIPCLHRVARHDQSGLAMLTQDRSGVEPYALAGG
jgi:hypothetical protein